MRIQSYQLHSTAAHVIFFAVPYESSNEVSTNTQIINDWENHLYSHERDLEKCDEQVFLTKDVEKIKYSAELPKWKSLKNTTSGTSVIIYIDIEQIRVNAYRCSGNAVLVVYNKYICVVTSIELTYIYTARTRPSRLDIESLYVLPPITNILDQAINYYCRKWAELNIDFAVRLMKGDLLKVPTTRSFSLRELFL